MPIGLKQKRQHGDSFANPCMLSRIALLWPIDHLIPNLRYLSTQSLLSLHASIASFKMPPRLNIPPVTRIALAGLGLQSLVNILRSNGDLLAWLNLVPQLSIFYPWTFLTTTLSEHDILSTAIAGLTLFHGGRYLERAWSSREFAKFLVVVSLIPNFLCFLLLIAMFTLTRSEHWT